MNKYCEILCRLFTNELFVECYFITSGKTLREALLFMEGKEDKALEYTLCYLDLVRKKINACQMYIPRAGNS